LDEKEIIELNKQLSVINKKIKLTVGDGNCLFSKIIINKIKGSVSDQLFQTESKHSEVRKKCVEYMKNNEEQFKYFVYDITFDEYLNDMKQDAGNSFIHL
jgi:hypothetical protein